MRLLTCLCNLFRPGTGRRRVHAAHSTAVARVAELEQRLAPLAGLVEVRCMVGDTAHPVWWTDGVPGDCPWCLTQTYADEAAELRDILVNLGGDGGGGVDVPAAADLPGSCFCDADPAPLPDFRIAADVPPGPVGEAADVNAETRPVDVRSLRAAMDATATHRVVAVPPATVNPGPVNVTWTGGLSTRPPMPDDTPTERVLAMTSVMPVWDSSITVVPAEVSPATGDRAQASVLAAVGHPR